MLKRRVLASPPEGLAGRGVGSILELPPVRILAEQLVVSSE